MRNKEQPGGTLPSSRGFPSARLVVVALLCLVAVLYGARAVYVAFRNSKPGSVTRTVELAITNPVSFTKSHVTGGIGAVLLVDPASGLPRIQTVVAGSPAQKAGLQ